MNEVFTYQTNVKTYLAAPLALVGIGHTPTPRLQKMRWVLIMWL